MTETSSGANAPEPLRDPQHSRLSERLKRHWVISAVVTLAALILIWLIVRAFAAPKPKPAAPPAIPVAVAPVKLGSIDIFLDALGTVTPVYTCLLYTSRCV